MQNFIVMTIALICLIIGSLISLFSTQPYRLSKKSLNWPHTPIKIEALDYKSEKYRDSNGKQRIREEIELSYTYKIDDKTFQSKRLNFDWKSSLTDNYEYEKYKELKRNERREQKSIVISIPLNLNMECYTQHTALSFCTLELSVQFFLYLLA